MSGPELDAIPKINGVETYKTQDKLNTQRKTKKARLTIPMIDTVSCIGLIGHRLQPLQKLQRADVDFQPDF